MTNIKLAMPLKGHVYHTKSDAELHYIAKDAGAAAKAMKGHSPQSEGKYLDQMNDAHTVLHYRKQGGKQVAKEETVNEISKGLLNKYITKAKVDANGTQPDRANALDKTRNFDKANDVLDKSFDRTQNINKANKKLNGGTKIPATGADVKEEQMTDIDESKTFKDRRSEWNDKKKDGLKKAIKKNIDFRNSREKRKVDDKAMAEETLDELSIDKVKAYAYASLSGTSKKRLDGFKLALAKARAGNNLPPISTVPKVPATKTPKKSMGEEVVNEISDEKLKRYNAAAISDSDKKRLPGFKLSLAKLRALNGLPLLSVKAKIPATKK